MIIGGSLHVNCQMVPCIADGIARSAARNPILAGIAPGIPLMASSNSAFMSPDEGFSIHKLVDIELQRLRYLDVRNPEIHIVGEIVKAWREGLAGIRKPLRREVSNQMIVPEHVRKNSLSADVRLSSTSAERRRTNSGIPPPRSLRPAGLTIPANIVLGRQ